MTRVMMFLIGTALVVPAPARAQAADAEAVLATVNRIFEGMREADSAKVRSSFHEGARFSIVTVRDGRREISFDGIDGWIRAIAGSNRRWDEILYDVEVHVDGDIASVWAPYNFYLDGQLRHCGIDSIELIRTDGGWKITQLADTRRTGGCRELPR